MGFFRLDINEEVVVICCWLFVFVCGVICTFVGCLCGDFWFCVRVVIFDVIKLVSEIFLFGLIWKVDVIIFGDILNFFSYDRIKFEGCICNCVEVFIVFVDVIIELFWEYESCWFLVLFFI